MPTYDPRTLGPEPRDPAQKFWDPAMQTMPREQLRDLQLERLRELVGKVLAGKARLFGRKLHARRHRVTRRHPFASTTSTCIPTTVKQELRDSEAEHPPFGEYRFTRRQDCVRLGSSTGTTGTPDAHAVDPPRHLARVRVGRPGVVAQRLATGPDRHARASRLPVRRRRDAVGLPRVLRHAQHLGGAPRHRRARRAGHPHVGAGPSGRVDGRVQLRPVRRGRGEAWART